MGEVYQNRCALANGRVVDAGGASARRAGARRGIVAGDAQEVEEDAHGVGQAHLRAGHVAPDREGLFEDGVAEDARRDAVQQFHVEEPAGAEGRGEDSAGKVAAEDFRAALRVVDGGVQDLPDEDLHQRAGGVAEEGTVDLRAEVGPARAEDGLGVGNPFQGGAEGGEFGERCGEVGVPEADPVRGGLGEEGLDAGADGLGLADIAGQIEGLDGGRLASRKAEGSSRRYSFLQGTTRARVMA